MRRQLRKYVSQSGRAGSKRISAGNERGQSAIEFALVFPLLMLIVTGQVAFGFALHNYMVLTNSINVGTQALAISRGQTTDPCATATAAIDSAALGLTTANLSFSYVIDGSTYSGTSCTSAVSSMVQGTSAQITATYPCTLVIYSMTIPSCTLRSQTTEIIQ
jgi:Flp pilus assembly protein TadG